MTEHKHKLFAPLMAAALVSGGDSSNAPEIPHRPAATAKATPAPVLQDYLDQLAHIKEKSEEAIAQGMVQKPDPDADLKYFDLLASVEAYIKRDNVERGFGPLVSAKLNRPLAPEGKGEMEDTLLPLFEKLEKQMFDDLRAKSPLKAPAR